MRKGNELLVQQRSANKSWCPLYYDLAFGGALSSEDFFGDRKIDKSLDPELVDDAWNLASDTRSTQREVLEEIGIELSEKDLVKARQNTYFKFVPANLFCSIYLINWDKAVTIQKEEIEKVEYWPLDQVLKRNDVKITPHSLSCFQ